MGSNLRIIARLDIKGPNLVKAIRFDGLRVIGDPQVYAKKYYEEGADELIYIDIVASLYGRNNLTEIVSRATQDVFIPITVGGGIRSVDDVKMLLRSGADKVAINTAAVKNPNLIHEVAQRFGSQCMVLSIEAKKTGPGRWEPYIDNGREKTGLDVVQWVKRGIELGAGEIFVTSVDNDGTRRGFDIDLIRAVTDASSVPVIAGGGMGNMDHLLRMIEKGSPEAVAIGSALHYNDLGLQKIRTDMLDAGLSVRKLPS